MLIKNEIYESLKKSLVASMYSRMTTGIADLPNVTPNESAADYYLRIGVPIREVDGHPNLFWCETCTPGTASVHMMPGRALCHAMWHFAHGATTIHHDSLVVTTVMH